MSLETDFLFSIIVCVSSSNSCRRTRTRLLFQTFFETLQRARVVQFRSNDIVFFFFDSYMAHAIDILKNSKRESKQVMTTYRRYDIPNNIVITRVYNKCRVYYTGLSSQIV